MTLSKMTTLYIDVLVSFYPLGNCMTNLKPNFQTYNI